MNAFDSRDCDEMNMEPHEFEQYVKNWFDSQGIKLKSYKSSLNNLVDATDGTYEIDIDITYEALNVDFRILVECKKYKGKVKREVILTLHQKIQSIGAHKGIVCSTSGFQSGALEFSKKHGIACIRVTETRFTIQTRSMNQSPVSQEYCDIFGLPKFTGYLIEQESDHIYNCSIVCKKDLKYISKFLLSGSE